MKNYIKLAKKILRKGHKEESRIGKTIALHNQTLTFNLKKSFPLMTTKFVGNKSIVIETLWYLKGTQYINYLEKNNVRVWSKFADSNNSVGKTYSYQFRNFNNIDQFKEVIAMLNKGKITNRRAIINLYNVGQLKEMSIPPCIACIQFNMFFEKGKKTLNTSIYQRSGDFCLGVPYDIAEMSLLAHIVAAYTESQVNDITFFYSNIHIYKDHIKTLKKQIKERPKKLPQLLINVKAIQKKEPEDLTPDLFEFVNIPEDRKKFKYKLF